ncbi:hypothetical protein K402DRAFT_173830 [Aulographum hederae CBS 113979]|uniref:Uncharacterized protein n=1 Tax=Aulographum hederae CBS 113979 TaxID=1176131 RepID=A0A6G1HDD4_9PEZI|nr:hypothetical protein K402DRAFT_173830 [Aulographum hederae CBS 113979]
MPGSSETDEPRSSSALFKRAATTLSAARRFAHPHGYESPEEESSARGLFQGRPKKNKRQNSNAVPQPGPNDYYPPTPPSRVNSDPFTNTEQPGHASTYYSSPAASSYDPSFSPPSRQSTGFSSNASSGHYPPSSFTSPSTHSSPDPQSHPNYAQNQSHMFGSPAPPLHNSAHSPYPHSTHAHLGPQLYPQSPYGYSQPHSPPPFQPGWPAQQAPPQHMTIPPQYRCLHRSTVTFQHSECNESPRCEPINWKDNYYCVHGSVVNFQRTFCNDGCGPVQTINEM